MKLTNLFESEFDDADAWLAQFEKELPEQPTRAKGGGALPGRDWMGRQQNPGVESGDPCPNCNAGDLSLKRGMGKDRFLFCPNCHTQFHLGEAEQPSVAAEPKFEEEAFGEHTCLRRPEDADDTAQMNKNARLGCAACAAMYDAWEPGAGLGKAPAAEPVESNVGGALRILNNCPELFGIISSGIGSVDDEDAEQELARRLILHWVGCQRCVESFAAHDPRRHHEAGQFGTGSPGAISAADHPIQMLLKLVRDYEIPTDPETHLARRVPVRALCGFGHTCGPGAPGRYPAWQYPMPDPLRTEPRAPGERKRPTYRFNAMFEEAETSDPWYTFSWPVSGLNGYRPKTDEFEAYVKSKLSCDVCNRIAQVRARQRGRGPRLSDDQLRAIAVEAGGCANSVSSQYGVPKPYCTEHIGESPYIQGLQSRLEALGPESQTSAYQEWQAEDKWLKEQMAAMYEVGDRVWRGTGESRREGTIVDIRDESVAKPDKRSKKPATHGVRWDNISRPVGAGAFGARLRGEEPIPQAEVDEWMDPRRIGGWIEARD